MYTGPQLIELLEKQHRNRQQSDLFKTGTFTLQWRAKVGSFPHPDVETIVSAGEPCGSWKPELDCPANLSLPEEKRKVDENLQYFNKLPLNGYIPGSVIRGLVRSWAKQRPAIHPKMLQLLGYQNDDTIQAGKIEFLDAWPEQPQKLTLDIVNPQQEFQVYHSQDIQSKPLSFYTLGNGVDKIPVTVAIRGIPGKANAAEVAEVWAWVQQALTLYGVGSRTASGYGAIASPDISKPILDPNYAVKTFDFTLYSQGCYGADSPRPGHSGEVELRPSHWRGWLRSWVLRFLLGVMSEESVKKTLGELLGTIVDGEDNKSYKGCVRSQMTKGEIWGEKSNNQPYFYTWKGQLSLSAPSDILNQIILPIVRFAVTVGGVGRGWRRPLHIFENDDNYSAGRGTHLTLTHRVKKKDTNDVKTITFALSLNPTEWTKNYDNWRTAVQNRWSSRVLSGYNNSIAEVFSPESCAIYLVPKPVEEPLNFDKLKWNTDRPDAKPRPTDTRGEGVNLIYQPRYKRKIEVGGNAAAKGGNSNCSWVTIKRVNIHNLKEDTDCQEIVCLFMGGQTPLSTHLRADFLKDLAKIYGAVHIFGVQPPSS